MWPTDRTFVVFVVPGEDPVENSALINKITLSTLRDLRWELDDIEMLGIIANPQDHGAAGIYFLDDMGIDTKSITLLLLVGNVSDSISFSESVSPDCGLGYVVLPESGAIIPTLRIPDTNDTWWDEPLHMEYACVTLAEMIRNGRIGYQRSEHVVFLADPSFWN